MAITKLNNVLVKHGRIMFAVITAIIIVSFVWFFTPGASGSILFDRNPASPNAVVGEVFGTKIKNKDMSEAIQAMTLVQAMLYNAEPNMEMFNISYDQAFIITAANAAAKHFGVTVSDSEVVKMIRETPTFQKDGKFNPEAYIAYEKEKLQPAGYNADDLENAVRIQLTVSSISKIIGEPVVSESELNEFIKTNLEKYDVLGITFRTADFKAGITASPAELQEFYKNNQDLFMRPEQFKAEAVFFPYSTYAAKAVPSAKEIKAYYDSRKSEFEKDGKVQPLAEVTGKISETLKQQNLKNLALAAATAFREKVYQATSGIAGDREAYLKEFQKIASKYPSKIQTGWFSINEEAIPGLGKDAAFSAAIAEQTKSNVPVTDPIAGENGVYVAAINGHAPAACAEYTEATEEVKEKFIEERAAVKANEALRIFAAAVISAQDPDSAKIRELAKNAQINQYEQFSLFPGTDKVPAEVIVTASGTATGKLSDAVPVQGGVMTVFVLNRTAPAAKEIETYKNTLSMYYNYAKQDAVSNALYDWINRNTKNFMVPQE